MDELTRFLKEAEVLETNGMTRGETEVYEQDSRDLAPSDTLSDAVKRKAAETRYEVSKRLLSNFKSSGAQARRDIQENFNLRKYDTHNAAIKDRSVDEFKIASRMDLVKALTGRI